MSTTTTITTNLVLTVIILSSLSISETDGAIKCYKCLITPPFYYSSEPFHLCQDFDYSDKFIVDCPLSTYCVKKIISAKIPVPINGTERDCASQSQVIQSYTEGKWHAKDLMEEPYEPGCRRLDDKGTRTSTTDHCYCNSDLCNSSRTFVPSRILCAILTVITITNYI